MSESWTQRLFGGFRKTSERLSENLSGITENLTAAVTKTKLDEDQLDDLEDALILSDLGPRAATRIRDHIAEQRFERGAETDECLEGLGFWAKKSYQTLNY